jgi:hypothetical protein
MSNEPSLNTSRVCGSVSFASHEPSNLMWSGDVFVIAPLLQLVEGSGSSRVRPSGSKSGSKKEWPPRSASDVPFSKSKVPCPTTNVDVGKSRGSPM